MAEYTEHYNLKKPTETEYYNVKDANTNNTIIDGVLFEKVDKIPNKGLSTNDFTDGYKKKIDSMQTLYRFKGVVNTINDLSIIENANIGDIYKCKENLNNYCWNGSDWIDLGQDIDLSNILEKIDTFEEQVNKKISESDNLIVSAVEPTGLNRKKVWFRKGKNLFNKEDVTDYDPYVNPAIYVKNDNDIYEEFIKKEESEINIVTGQEIATAEYINGKQVFIKELETGNLGNADYTYIQTRLTNVNYIKCEGRVFNGSITFMLPHIGSSEQENIALFINGDIINIKTGTNRTTFSGKVRVYYTKN